MSMSAVHLEEDGAEERKAAGCLCGDWDEVLRLGRVGLKSGM